ncbi:hypothetical protein [Companilactobacillus keshanensis]|uniref:Surface layer protein A domain-containing protein n=1 Tax=Companilactobacillus keshanensis TaxID=2486003 RepID=A0ABW4BT15_9LACO|nr:hypothetical protein [Companilactobacillus keshanensis]
MKKSIKYAGIAAATLLAVAPVVAPVVSSTTTVQAATATSADADAYVAAFKSSATYNKAQAAQFNTADFDKKIGATTFLSNDFFKNFLSGKDAGSLTDDNASVKFTATDSNNKELDAAGVQTALNGAKAVNFNVALSYFTEGTNTTTKNFTIALTPTSDQTSTITSLAAKFTTPYDVNYGSNTADAKAQKSTDLSLTDQSEKALLSDTNEVSEYSLGGFFNSYADALNGGTAASVGSTFTTTDGSSTEYYQPITVTVSADSALGVYLKANSNSSTYTVNGSSKTTTDNGKVGTDADGNTTLTFVRTVNVAAQSDSDWTVKDVKGIVKTNSDKAFYTLHNDADELVSNRALDKNSSWQTDKVRTNTAGDKQYRVSTHEWIPSTDVTFDGSEIDTGTTDPAGALTVTKLDKNKIINVSTSGMVYFLYNSKGVKSDTRALGGGTSWQVDKTATDAAGNTYYGVSTDEFVKVGEGVTLAN